MPSTGHRDRLRALFAAGTLRDEPQLLELLLTYAVPRIDVAPVATSLLERFGTLAGVLAASQPELTAVEGCGPNTALFLKLIAAVVDRSTDTMIPPVQPPLWHPLDGEDSREEKRAQEPPAERELRTFGSDEVTTTLGILSNVQQLQSIDELKCELHRTLPYNSESTRIRRANYVLNRFFPEGTLDTPLAYFAGRCEEADLKLAVFYEMLRAEPVAARVAEEVVWPALPRGFVSVDAIREQIEARLHELKQASQKKTLQSVLRTYSLLGIAARRDDGLLLQLQEGTAASFLYVLAAECPDPGMYHFEYLDEGPMRRWLLWNKDWIHAQIYALQDLGILAKVSEIDAYRQFTVAYTRREALERFFRARKSPAPQDHGGGS